MVSPFPWKHHRENKLEEEPPDLCSMVCPEQGLVSLPPHLEGVEEEGEEHLDVAQDARGLLIGGKDENDLVDPEEGDEGQGGFGQPGGE